MREIIAIIVLIMIRLVIDLEDGGFCFAIPLLIGIVTLIYLCCALGERFFAHDIQTWFRIDPEGQPLPPLPGEEETQDGEQQNHEEDEKPPKYW